MKLYYAPGACSLAPHIVAREAGIPLELVRVDLARHVTETGADYTKLSPNGYVPAIELADGEVLTEAAVLVQWLAEQAPAAGLLPPAGTPERLQAQIWLNFVATELHKSFSPWLWHQDTAASTRAAVLEKLARRFAHLGRHLAGRPYLLGERFTVVDAYAFTIVNWADLLKLDLEPYPQLRAYLERIRARPKVREALAAEGLLRQAA
jgi:glutathione S-transferase